MKRPFLVWLAFAACAALGFGVLGWFTREMLRLDRESIEARQLAAVEENIRLALWRMDSALASVHGLEAARPWQEYESFYRADAAYSAEFSPLPAGTVMLPSPLLAYTPAFVKLHFQIEPDSAIRSPQSPPSELRPAALAAGISVDRLDHTALTLVDLRTRLVTTDLAASLPPVPAAPFAVHELTGSESNKESLAQSLVSKLSRQKAESETAATTNEAAPAADAFVTPPTQAINAPLDEIQIQQLKSTAEQFERANTLAASNFYNADAAEKRRAQSPVQLAEALTADDFRASPGSASSAALTSPAPALSANQPTPVRAVGTRSQGAGTPPTSLDVRSDRPVAVAQQQADASANAASSSGALFADAAKPQNNEQQAVVEVSEVALALSAGGAAGPLQAVWAGDELVFARRAVIDGREVVQGAWLDWPELRAWLLSRVSDLLPQARLDRALPGTAATALDAARRLAFLPVQLVPGVVPVDTGSFASPLRLSLGTAWVGAIVGLAALALLLRGTLRLSERRGAFVSAVTHELRTPLTTFRMYTEMLAGGMVTDETKRRGYIDTLHKESERLSHLVENVLSYARLERGRASSRVEDTTPGALLARIEERLRERAQQGGLTVGVEFADGIADTPLHTDTTAVEQVLFNLVDNATKYGRPKDGGGEISIRAALFTPRRLAIRVTDQGSGLTSAARKRLFQPFSKSATEAAHSQPGVGLGLALCRRLARDELHGDLVLERTGADGTVFRLELPIL